MWLVSTKLVMTRNGLLCADVSKLRILLRPLRSLDSFLCTSLAACQLISTPIVFAVVFYVIHKSMHSFSDRLKYITDCAQNGKGTSCVCLKTADATKQISWANCA